MDELQHIIEQAWEDRSKLEEKLVVEAIESIIEDIDKGKLRCAEPTTNGWQVNEWVKKAVILYFPTRKMETLKAGPLEFHDKIPLKKGYKELGIRVVPHAVARYGAYISKGVIMMPSYVNIGANCFLGSRSIVVEGIRIEKEAVLGANVVLTASTKIIDVTGDEPKQIEGYVPARSVVIPGSYTKKFPAGEYQVPCALIIGTRKESTNKKTSLNDALREYGVSV